MADSGTIREFLATLGFKIDEDGLRKFTGALTNLATRAAGLGLALEGAAVAVGAAVTAMADHFEQLFFLSQRVGSSIENITAFEYGLRQIGLSASTADAAISSLSMAMQMNPGMEGLLHGLGVQTRDAHGGLLDTEETLDNLIGRLKGIQFPIASRLAQMFGIDPTTLKQMEINLDATRNAMREWHQEAARAGVDLNAFGENAHAWMVQVRGLGSQLDLIWYSVVNRLSGSTGLLPVLQQLRQWITAHQKDIVTAVTAVANSIVSIGTNFANTFPIIDELVKMTTGWATALNLVGDIIIYRIFGPLGLVLKLMGDMLQWEKENPGKSLVLPVPGVDPDEANRLMRSPMAPWAKKLWDWLSGNAGAGSDIPPGTVPPSQLFPDAAPQGGSMFPPWMHPGNWKYQNGQPVVPMGQHASYQREMPSADDNAPTGDPSLPLGVRQNNPGNLRNWDTAIGHNKGFAIFKTAEDGLIALRDNLLSYGRKGIDTVTSIISRWAPPSENDTGSYIAMIARALGVDPNAHLNLSDPRIMQALITGITRVENGMVPYSKDLIGRVAGGKGQQAQPEAHHYLGRTPSTAGGSGDKMGAPNIQQTNNFNINGATDPHRVGQEVAVRQRGVNSDLVRSATGGIYA